MLCFLWHKQIHIVMPRIYYYDPSPHTMSRQRSWSSWPRLDRLDFNCGLSWLWLLLRLSTLIVASLIAWTYLQVSLIPAYKCLYNCVIYYNMYIIVSVYISCCILAALYSLYVSWHVYILLRWWAVYFSVYTSLLHLVGFLHLPAYVCHALHLNVFVYILIMNYEQRNMSNV